MLKPKAAIPAPVEQFVSTFSIIRVFARQTKWTPTDSLVFIGDPPLFRPQDKTIPVRVSVTFLWDIEEGQRIAKAWGQYYNDIQIGGPAFNDIGGNFTPGKYIKHGVTITSRGCVKKCPWCFVWRREGKIRELPIRQGHILQDNNILACSRPHIEKVFDMLRQQKKGISFNGGLDTTLLQDWHRELLDTIKIHELWFACDDSTGIPSLERTSKILDGISINKRRCYVLVGFNGESIADAEKRLERVYELGFLPFCQLFRGQVKKEWGQDWKDLSRKWSRPAIYRC